MAKKQRAGNSKKAVAYIRVSTDDQALGPEAQRRAIEQWAARGGIEVVDWHEDLGVSGGRPLEECPGLLAAVDSLSEHRAGVLIVAKRDRLARDVMKAAMVEALAERQGAVVSSAAGEGEGTDPTAALMRRIVDAFAEYERALIRARTKAAMGVKKARNERVGSIPYGYMLDEDGPTRTDASGQERAYRLKKNPEEQRVIRFILEERQFGASYKTIIRALEAVGYKPRSGGRWYPTQIRRILEAQKELDAA